MDIIKSIKKLNIFAYSSFLLNIMICSDDAILEQYGLLGLIPYITIAVSTAEFNTRGDDRLKKMFMYSVPDFIIRFVSMLLCFFMTTLNYDSRTFRLCMICVIILFITNIMLETAIVRKALSLNLFMEKQELMAEEIIARETHGIVIRQAFSGIESSVLYACMILTFGLGEDINFLYQVICFVTIVCLIVIYINMTIISLRSYYEENRIAKKIFINENITVAFMLPLMIAYSYYSGYHGFKDFIVYIVLFCLTIPRAISRRKRLEDVYNKYLVK